MAGRIRREDIDLLRERADMIALVSDHTKLKRAGQRMKGLCPFHSEKTPSFTIDPAQGLYYCFGCNEGGDVYDFLMKVEGLTFTEAVEHVARRSGYTLRYEEMTSGEKRALGRRTKLVAINQAALEWFRERLLAAGGSPARDYLASRGFGEEEIERFQLGFAPNEWERLTRHLLGEGFDRDDVITSGLVQEGKGSRLRDRFRGRLIFPVRDVSGDPIGFGGRVLPAIDYGDFEPPKYYNSPETPLYKKTQVLYGLHLARAQIVRADQVVVCEGYTDVMALHQAGFGRSVATCGTAVTAEHLRMLSRYASQVVLAFDADEAGAKAAQAAFEQAGRIGGGSGAAGAGLELAVLALPPGRDPADVVHEEGVAAVHTPAEDAVPVIPFLIRRRVAEVDEADDRDRAEVLREVLGLLGHEPDRELRRTYADTEIARPLGVSLDYVERTAERVGVDLDRHVGIETGRVRDDSGGSIARLDRARARLERRVLRAALQQPDDLPEEWFELEAGVFRHPKGRAVFETIEAAGGVGVALQTVLEACPDDELRDLIRRIAMEEPEGGPSADAVTDVVRRLLSQHLAAEADDLAAELGQVHHDADPERFRDLNRRIAELRTRSKQLQRRP